MTTTADLEKAGWKRIRTDYFNDPKSRTGLKSVSLWRDPKSSGLYREKDALRILESELRKKHKRGKK